MSGRGFEVASQPARIVVVDDDEPLRKLMRRALTPEHEVLTVASAEEALDWITAGEPFDIILCDLMLPGMSGMAFHERVGEVAPKLVARILFMTGGAYTPAAAAFLARPDIQHLEKPFASVAALRAAVDEHLRRLRKGDADPGDGSR